MGPPNSLSEAFLKEEDLGLKDLERIVGREVAAVHTHPRHLHPNEPRVGLQKIPDVQIRATNKDPSPPWCILVPSRVYGPFVRPPSPWQSAAEGSGLPSLSRGLAVETSLSTPQPPKHRPEYWARAAPRSMGDIFFTPIGTREARRRSLALLGHVRRAPTPPAGVLPAWKRAAARHMAIPLAPEAPGNLDMLSDAAIHPPHP